jgi:hypothetical protein
VPPVTGLEHKDERLHAVEGADWRDKLAELRDELPEPDEEPDPAGDSTSSDRRR